MAEPARKQKDAIQPDIRPDLKAIDGGGETTPDRPASLQALNGREENPDTLNTDDVPLREETPDTTWEYEPGTDEEGDKKKKKVGFIRRMIGNHRWLTGAGVGVGLLSIPVLLLSLLPLKLEMFIKNITEISFTVPGTAIDIRLEDLVMRGLAARAIMAANPGDPDAGLVFCKGGGIACSLFQTYTTDYYEKKLGIKLDVGTDGRVELGGRAAKWTVSVQPGDKDIGGVVKRIEINSNGEMKKYIKDEVNKQGKHHSYIERLITRKLIQKKLGVVFWRGPPFVEKAVNRYEAAKTNIKAAIVKATLGRISPRLATYLTCLQGDIDVCKKLHTDYSKTASTVPDNPADEEGVDKDSEEYKAAQAEYDAKSTAANGIADIEIGEDAAKDVVKGLITKRILAIVGGGVAIAGVLDLIFSAIESLDQGALEQIWFDMSNQTYMGFSTEVITAYQKWKAGDLDLASFEVLNELFNNAEKSPLQQAENGGNVDTSEGITTKCASVNGVDGEDVNTKLKPGQLVCDEQKITRDYSSAFTDNPAWAVLAEIAPVWNGTAGVAFDFVNGVAGAFLGAIPGFNQLMSLAGGLAEPVITWMIGLIFEPPLVGTIADGARNYVGLSGGIRATQNLTMEEGVAPDSTALGGGGGLLTDSELAAIGNEADKNNKEYFDSQPLLARIFSLDLTGSFAQQFVSKLPTSVGSLAKMPLSSFGQLLSGTHASAATTSDTLNPFGLPMYGYALDDPSLKADPSLYTEEYCATTAKARLDSYSKEEGDIIPVYHKSDPCALEKVVVGTALNAAGVTDDKYSLKPLETEIESTTGSETASTSPSSITVVVNKKHPLNPTNYAPSDLTDIGGGYVLRSEAAAAFGTMKTAAAAAGNPISPISSYRSYDTQVSVYAGWVADLGQAGADLTSARPGFSEHQTGFAVDIDSLDQSYANTAAGKWLAANSYQYGFVLRYPNGKTATTGYEFEPWHYRYIGVKAATDMHTKGITTLEEYFKVSGGDYAYIQSSNNTSLSSIIKTRNDFTINARTPISVGLLV